METIGRYRVLRPLASGGMGQVFLAEDPKLERQVALKLLHRDPERGLRREAKTLAALSHPNIVTIFEIGEHDGQDFIAMEYLSGKTLRDILAARPSREELIAIVQSVAVAVAAAHKAGILHRDIKPENVVSTPNGVKVVDFGIARRLNQRASTTNPDDLYEMLLTPGPTAGSRTLIDGVLETAVDTRTATAGTQTVFGTPAYMAPEVLGGEPSSAASDVYSLGVMLYECLAGKRPYDAGNLIETIAHIIQAPTPTTGDPLDPLLARMLAREPAMRPPLGEVIAALRPAEVAPPPTRPGKPWWIAGVALGAIGFAVAYSVMSTRTSDVQPDARAPMIKRRIGMAIVDVDIPWGINRSDGDAVARTLVTALSDVQNAEISAVVVSGLEHAAQLASAKDNGVEYLVSMKIVEDNNPIDIVGTLAIYDVATGKLLVPETTHRAKATQVRGLEYQMLDALLEKIAPGASLKRVHDREKAEVAVNDGRTSVQGGNFDRARTQFEAAVSLDPTLPEAWYGYALALGWTEAPEDVTLQAAEKAYELAPEGRRKELMRGAALFFRDRYAEARGVLEKIEALGDAGPDQLELLYYLGDANWHDGRHAAGYRYFRRAYAIPPRSRAMAIHPAQYLIARRQADEARYLAGAAGLTDINQIDFSIRNYPKLAADSTAGLYQIASKIVIGDRLSEATLAAAYTQPIELAALHSAMAFAAGDRTTAVAVFEKMWRDHVEGKRLTSGDYYLIEFAGEVMIAGGFVDEAKRIVKLLADNSAQRPRRGYHRLSMLLAGQTRDAALIVSGPTVSERSHQLQAAAEAEIAGDHAKAASLLAEIVHNPTFTWDYPERAALLRNLRAINDKPAIAALCKDTLEPAIYHHAFIVLRALCR